MIRLFVALILTSFVLAACETVPGGSNNGVHRITAREADQIRLNQMDLINTVRAERGLQPVTLSAELTAAAETHARDMAVQKRAWNFGSDHSSPQARAERAGFVGLITGENVAETYEDNVTIFQVWYSDPRAREAMMHPDATHVGFGWYQEPNGKLWWVQDMGAATPPVAMAVSQ